MAEASFPWAPGKTGDGRNSWDQEGLASNSDREKLGRRALGGSCLQLVEEELEEESFGVQASNSDRGGVERI